MARNYTKGARTAAAFQEAALRRFALDGYLRTKVEDIAREANKSAASFYNYFDNKADVLAAIARDLHENALRLHTTPDHDKRTSLDAVTEVITNFWTNYRDRLGAWSGIFQASMIDPEFLEQWRTIRADAVSSVAHGIRAAQAQGYCPGIDPELTASSLSSMIEHSCYVWLAQGGGADSADVDEARAIETLVNIWHRSIFWRSDGSRDAP